MEEMYHPGVQTQWPMGLDEHYGFYDAPLHLPFGYGDPSIHPDPSMRLENHFPAVERASVVPNHHQGVEYNGSVQAEGPDPTSRPRLTTDQTNILESKFQQDPKPPTDTKKELAQKIGLTLDKVNNWYQNRRAKAKNAKKNIETFGVLQVSESSNNWQFPEYPPSVLQPPQFQTSPASSAVPSSADLPISGPSVNGTNGDLRHEDHTGFIQPRQITIPHEPVAHPTGQQSGPVMRPIMTLQEQMQMERAYNEMNVPYPSQWGQPDNLQRTQMENVELASTLRRMEEDNAAMEVMQRTQVNHGSQFPPEIQAPNPISPLPFFLAGPSRPLSPYNTQDTAELGWPSTEQQPDQMIMQQPAMPNLTHAYDPNQSSTVANPGAQNPVVPTTQSPDSAAYAAPLLSQGQALYQSPSTSSFTSLAQPVPEKAPSRRGSDSSELASNFDTIHLQKVQSQQTSDEEVFKTPQIPQMNLAARRKRRPAALGSVGMRSQSCTGPQDSSPSAKTATLGPAQLAQVRRIKSTGNSLNVIGGRVQKSGIASAQRSPLNFSTFQEAEAIHHINAYTAASPSHSQSTSTNGHVPMTPHTPSAIEHPPVDWSKSLVHSSSNPNMFQNQQFHSSSYDNHVSSPPTTPYMHLPMYMNQPQHHLMAPPQSAPAHITHFPNFSPPFQPMPGTPNGYFPPQAVSNEPFHFQAGPQVIPVQKGPMFDFQPQLDMYGYQQPHIVNSSPPFAGHPGFYAIHPPQTTKELEVVMTTFPKPADGNSPPKEPHRPKQFTFQNSGPADF
ncbi:hypothetical protein MMC30_000973 [Trapelia coarctata]|nr:hypothetical protein [Trapelia coarctata]